MEGALASATSAEKNAFAAAFNTFLQSYRSAIEPNPVDDLPPPVQDPDIPASARVPSEQELKDVGLGEAAGKEVDEELARPGHFQSMAKAAPTVSSSKADSSLKAPAVPVNPNIGTKLAARAKRIFDEDPVAAKANWEEMQERLDQVAYIINPYVSRNRQYMLNAHSLFLGIYRPELSPEAHWHTDVVAQFAGNTLVYRITTSRGQDGGPIQSRTAVGWLGHHIHNVCTYTQDPQTGARTGLTLLRRGLYNRLENIVKWCVIEYNLIRHSKIQQRLDRHALQLIFEVIIKRTKEHGRAGGFQTIMAANFALSGALRPGSLQANHKDYAKRGMFMKTGDCEVSVVRRFCWSLKVTVDQWKGHMGVTGERKVLTFGPVSKAHNLIFEPVVFFILDVLARGGFRGIKTLEELLACEAATLPMEESFKLKPLWLKRGPRGLSLIEGEPAPPHALSSNMNYWGFEAGISGASIYGIRRYGGNIYAASMGRDLTLFLLNHRDRTGVTMDNHYTTGVEDIPLTRLLLGELSGKLTETEKLALENNKRASAAMNFLIRRVQATNPEIDMYTDEAVSRRQYGLSPEDEEAIKGNKLLDTVTKECHDAWDDIMALVQGKRPSFSDTSGKQLRGILKRVPVQDRVKAEARATLFRRLDSKRKDIKKKALRVVREQRVKSAVRARPEATYKDRDAAEKLLDEESPWYGEVREILEKGVKKYLRSQEKPSPSKAQLTKEDADAAEEPQEVQAEIAKLQVQEAQSDDEDEGDDEDDEQDITDGNDPLPGNRISPPKAIKSKAKISPLDANLQRFPFDIDTEEEEPTFDDSKEPDALGINVDAARSILIKLLWADHEAQVAKKKTWKPKGKQAEKGSGPNKNKDGLYECDLCVEFTSRGSKPATLDTISNLERHKREKHDEWSNLELEMETENLEEFKCPGCDKMFTSLVSCKIHCWRDCPQKEKYLPLYRAHEALRGTRQRNIADQDNRRKEDSDTIGQLFSAPQYGTTMAEDLHKAFTNDPNALQGWADRKGDQATNMTRGMTLDTIQQSFGQLAGLAAGRPYQGIGNQQVRDYSDVPVPSASQLKTVTALGPNFMSERKARMMKAMQADMKKNPHDYEEPENDEGESNGDED